MDGGDGRLVDLEDGAEDSYDRDVNANGGPGEGREGGERGEVAELEDDDDPAIFVPLEEMAGGDSEEEEDARKSMSVHMMGRAEVADAHCGSKVDGNAPREVESDTADTGPAATVRATLMLGRQTNRFSLSLPLSLSLSLSLSSSLPPSLPVCVGVCVCLQRDESYLDCRLRRLY